MARNEEHKRANQSMTPAAVKVRAKRAKESPEEKKDRLEKQRKWHDNAKKKRAKEKKNGDPSSDLAYKARASAASKKCRDETDTYYGCPVCKNVYPFKYERKNHMESTGHAFS